jgi:hypothetical protein
MSIPSRLAEIIALSPSSSPATTAPVTASPLDQAINLAMLLAMPVAVVIAWRAGVFRRRSIIGRWPNGCHGSRGIAFDERDGFVFAACSEGKLVALDANHQGRQVGLIATGRGVDVIGYDPKPRHLYVPAAESANLTIIDVSPTGHLTRLSVVPAPKGGHCATADDRGHAWVCDPAHGQLLIFTDARR